MSELFNSSNPMKEITVMVNPISTFTCTLSVPEELLEEDQLPNLTDIIRNRLDKLEWGSYENDYDDCGITLIENDEVIYEEK